MAYRGRFGVPSYPALCKTEHPRPTFSSYCVTTWDMAIWLVTANLISTHLI